MPAIVRIGDANVAHCSGHTMESGSTNYFVDGIGVCRDGDSTTSHLTPPNKPPCPPHTAQVDPASRGWYVDGKRVAALGDSISGCTSTAQGSPHWFVG